MGERGGYLGKDIMTRRWRAEQPRQYVQGRGPLAHDAIKRSGEEAGGKPSVALDCEEPQCGGVGGTLDEAKRRVAGRQREGNHRRGGAWSSQPEKTNVQPRKPGGGTDVAVGCAKEISSGRRTALARSAPLPMAAPPDHLDQLTEPPPPAKAVT